MTDRSTLMDAARGAGSIIHCVSYVGSDADHAWHINDAGSRIVVEVAEELGIPTLVYVSTTGVYGGGAHHETPEGAPTTPMSETSRSRRSAERRVLAAGGSVIRPHLTYRVGDRWFIPQLIRAAALLGGMPRRVTTSTINVDDLANQIWALHDHAIRHPRGGLYNALHNAPVTLHAILRECRARLDRPIEAGFLDPEQAGNQLLGNGVSVHQVDMLTKTNTFSSSLPTVLSGFSAPGRFRLSTSARAWYVQT